MATSKQRTAIAGLVLSAMGLVSIAVSESYTSSAVIPIPGDKLTIGFGTTEGVKAGDKITPPVALARALQDIQKYEGALKKCVKAPLHQYEYDAYIELEYNVGEGAFCGSSIPAKLAAGDYAGACKTILDFDKYRDRTKPKVRNPRTGAMEYPLVKIRGLTIRRQREYTKCMGLE